MLPHDLEILTTSGLESGNEKNKKALCLERNVEIKVHLPSLTSFWFCGQDYHQKERELSDERATAALQFEQPFPRQHDLGFPGQGPPLLGHGLAQWGRLALPHGQNQEIQ